MLHKTHIAILLAGLLVGQTATASRLEQPAAAQLDTSGGQLTVFNPDGTSYVVSPGQAAMLEPVIMAAAQGSPAHEMTVFDPNGTIYYFAPGEEEARILPRSLIHGNSSMHPIYVAHFVSTQSNSVGLDSGAN